MARMMPDALPSKDATGRKPRQGERNVFEILAKLPDECLVYYEPLVHDRHPDFVVILPSVGLLVIEVKDWSAGNITCFSPTRITVTRGEEAREHLHPLEQARDYRERIENKIFGSRFGRPLTHFVPSKKPIFRPN